MKNELVFTQKVDGSFINHCSIEIPKVNFKVKHFGVVKSGLPYHEYLKLNKEVEERVNKFKKERQEKLTKKVNYQEIYNYSFNQIEQIQLTQ